MSASERNTCCGTRTARTSACAASQLREGERRARARRLALQHAQEAEVVGDVVDDEAQQEAIVERLQLVVLRQLVAGAEEGDERHLGHLAPVVEAALVDQREDGIEDGGVGLEDLIEEGDVRFRQLAGGDAAILVILQGPQRRPRRRAPRGW